MSIDLSAALRAAFARNHPDRLAFGGTVGASTARYLAFVTYLVLLKCLIDTYGHAVDWQVAVKERLLLFWLA